MDLLTTLLPALIPPVADGIRGAIAKLTGSAGREPQNVDEAIALMQADTDRLQALAELDKPGGNISQWVADLRASARYLATFAAIGYGAALTVIPEVEPTTIYNGQQLMASAFFFLFGDRVYLHLRRG